MAYFEFPHTRNYDGDLGWVIKKIIELTDRYNDFFEYNSITFADPLQWDITKQYPPYQIVFDYDAGYSYISKRPVPAGVTITNPDYWCLVGPLIVDAYARSQIQTILEFITNIYEASNIATAVRAVGDYVTANGQLYKVTAPINIGEGYTEGINVTKTTIETMIHEIITADTASMVSDISDLQGDVLTLGNDLTKFKTNTEQPFTILIGDSYGEGYDPGGNNDGWCAYLLNMGIRGISSYAGGSGFGLTPSDPRAPYTLLSNVTLPTGVTANDVKRIICAIGYNDFKANKTTVKTNLADFKTYANSVYPNAVVYIGMIGYAWTNNENLIVGSDISATVAAYGEACKDSGAVFMPQLTAVLLGCNGMSTADYKHPNAIGNQAIAKAIYSVLNGGGVVNKSGYIVSMANAGIGFTAEYYHDVTVQDGIIKVDFKFNNFTIDNGSAVNLYSGVTATPTHAPILPPGYHTGAHLFNNQDTGSGLGKAYYCCDIAVEPGVSTGFAMHFNLINDAGNNFGMTKKCNINDNTIHSWSTQF